MYLRDIRPLPDSPATQRIVQIANNRFGVALSSLYAFWTARDTAVRAGAAAGPRRDAYTVVTFRSGTSVGVVLIFDISLTSA